AAERDVVAGLGARQIVASAHDRGQRDAGGECAGEPMCSKGLLHLSFVNPFLVVPTDTVRAFFRPLPLLAPGGRGLATGVAGGCGAGVAGGGGVEESAPPSTRKPSGSTLASPSTSRT